jgi:hypothetical protein
LLATQAWDVNRKQKAVRFLSPALSGVQNTVAGPSRGPARAGVLTAAPGGGSASTWGCRCGCA